MLFPFSCQSAKLIHKIYNCSVRLLFGAAGRILHWSGSSLCSSWTQKGVLSAPGKLSLNLAEKPRRCQEHTILWLKQKRVWSQPVWGSVCVSFIGICSCLAEKWCDCLKWVRLLVWLWLSCVISHLQQIALLFTEPMGKNLPWSLNAAGS